MALLQFGLQGVIGGGGILREIINASVAGVRSAHLNGPGTGGRDVDGVSGGEEGALVADVIHLDYRVGAELALDAEIPMLVIAHPCLG